MLGNGACGAGGKTLLLRVIVVLARTGDLFPGSVLDGSQLPITPA